MADYYCENCEFFEDRSTDKLINGFCKKNKQSPFFYDWWQKCDNCVIETLQAENAALRERLEKAVELPVKVGDTVYLLSQTSRCPAGEIVEAKIIDFIGWEDGYRFTAKGGREWFSFLRGDIGTWVFTTREAALARLAELKGGKG